MAIFIWLSGYQKLEEENVAWWTSKGFVGTMDYEQIYNGFLYLIFNIYIVFIYSIFFLLFFFGQTSPTFIYVRLASVMMGILLVIFTYLALRALGCRRISSLFAAWMVLTDGLVTVDSRLILTDIYLWCFHVMTIFATFASTVPRSTSLQVRFSSLLNLPSRFFPILQIISLQFLIQLFNFHLHSHFAPFSVSYFICCFFFGNSFCGAQSRDSYLDAL